MQLHLKPTLLPKEPLTVSYICAQILNSLLFL
nr:MAG TPA: hypothetical protein [Caudoviricetes sp.]